ncbi:putative bifunctional diguanylate cyclase/phosphodiesterase [Pseudoalteromonas sp.]|uniref:putative bifunctional diguanylate cyclase/phosphodiesterase n=1 Tax=Pseudoalteromonas sp. TaxID=53249 RepID=UPI00356171BD
MFNSHQAGVLIVSDTHRLLYTNEQASRLNTKRKTLYCDSLGKITHYQLKENLHTHKQFKLQNFTVSIVPIEYNEQPSKLIRLKTNMPQSDVVSKLNLGLITFDMNGTIISTNNYFDEICKRQVKHIEELLYEPYPHIFESLNQPASKSCRWQTIKLKYLPRNRHYEYVINQHHQHYLMQVRDVTQLTLKHRALQQQAALDPLTGLANRQVFEDRLSQALIRTKRSQQKIALALLDLDDFKQVNDSLGHHVGDQLLNTIACRLKEYVRKSDTVARLGGDEFCIIFEQVNSEQSVRSKLRKLNDALSRPIMLQGHTLYPKASLGACITDGNLDENEIYKRADAAMYGAKNMKRGSVKLHQATESFNHSSSIKEQLNNEIDYSQFELFFQPSVTTNTQQVCSIEALLRWRENGKPSLPKEFFNVIESEGHANKIESWVIHEACRCRKTWAEKKLIDSSVPISINISKSYFYHPNFLPHLHNELARFNISPEMIELDIEESCLTSAEKKSLQITKKLSDIGVKIAIDRFGSSHTSLRTLHDFPINRIKLDRKLVANLDSIDSLLVKSIINAAQQLNIEVVGEGVESDELIDFYTDCSCDALQGYIISRPAKQQSLELYLKSQCEVHC